MHSIVCDFPCRLQLALRIHRSRTDYTALSVFLSVSLSLSAVSCELVGCVRDTLCVTLSACPPLARCAFNFPAPLSLVACCGDLSLRMNAVRTVLLAERRCLAVRLELKINNTFCL